MKNGQMIALLCALALGLVAATSANAGLAVFRSLPNDLPNLPRLAVLHSTPNDLPGLPYAEYFIRGLSLNEKTTGATLTFTNIRYWAQENDKHMFINQSTGGNFAGQGKLAGNWPNLLGSKPQNFNTVIEFDKLGFWDMLNAYVETTPDTDQTSFGFRIDPDCNDMTPARTTEILTPIGHHSP